MKQKGFTLVELLVVMGIIGVLAVGTISYIGRGPAMRARDGRRKADIEMIRAALELFKADDVASSYPASLTCGAALTNGTNTYINKVPCDPRDGSAYQYTPSGAAGAYYNYELGGCLEISDGGTYICSSTTCGAGLFVYCINNP